MTDDQILNQHDRNVRIVSEAVFSLVERFQPNGMTPAAAFEGAVKGGALAMAVHCHDTPTDIAEILDEMADALRTMPADAFLATRN